MNKRTTLLCATIITFGLGCTYLGLTMKKPDSDSWDILIFTQTWPTTLCYTWKEHNASHECHYPPVKNQWTIHGIWPTKLGTIGPGFCNKTMVFDENALYGIKDDLNKYWTDIELPQLNVTMDKTNTINITNVTMNTNNITVTKKESIWQHEWEKHGTCAVSLPSLKSEFYYFYQGITWAKKYPMKDILEKAGIAVNSSLTVDDYLKKIKSVLNVNVYVFCFHRKDTDEQLLNEIRICFNKNLELIDCDGIKNSRGYGKSNSQLTNCDKKKPILYLDYVTPHNNSNSNDNEWDYLVFSQTWPYTFCHTWTIDSSSHTCNLPQNRNQWTIHGIWPNKIGTSGPFYCNNQTVLNLDVLDSIKSEMKNRWTEVKNSNSWLNKKEGELWKHEWTKHGTCAKSLPALDTELKYFQQALNWSIEYPLNNLLAKGGIQTDGSYPLAQYWQTLITALGKRPFIDCYTDKKNHVVYIDEVRICFNKLLKLIDCDSFRHHNDKPYTNCPDNNIYYPGVKV
ncbi:uncharacterized protein LOC126896220 isoform X2 [Daktulosphaira vitifoliae]|uniref:uncharacterized protein LOC126896220 isoform X2 n=1 Tax=Daktulosphaira vitifoliae TaxID=58002 RepID=UPI0021AAE92C|nr:uncharacterized protein LOC126896220 isoform X2 [Daktulosphaira vitifoliae]